MIYLPMRINVGRGGKKIRNMRKDLIAAARSDIKASRGDSKALRRRFMSRTYTGYFRQMIKERGPEWWDNEFRKNYPEFPSYAEFSEYNNALMKTNRLKMQRQQMQKAQFRDYTGAAARSIGEFVKKDAERTAGHAKLASRAVGAAGAWAGRQIGNAANATGAGVKKGANATWQGTKWASEQGWRGAKATARGVKEAAPYVWSGAKTTAKATAMGGLTLAEARLQSRINLANNPQGAEHMKAEDWRLRYLKGAKAPLVAWGKYRNKRAILKAQKAINKMNKKAYKLDKWVETPTGLRWRLAKWRAGRRVDKIGRVIEKTQDRLDAARAKGGEKKAHRLEQKIVDRQGRIQGIQGRLEARRLAKKERADALRFRILSMQEKQVGAKGNLAILNAKQKRTEEKVTLREGNMDRKFGRIKGRKSAYEDALLGVMGAKEKLKKAA
ncbi:MAG: hypothetical protein V1676_01145 [Candidatus Diapherotrites archaeon]